MFFVSVNRITKPLKELVSVTKRIAAGDTSIILKGSKHGELGMLINSFNSMSGALKEAQHKLRLAERHTAWREMARMLAHGIKTPLTSIRLSIQRLREKYLGKSSDLPDVRFEEQYEPSIPETMVDPGQIKQVISDIIKNAIEAKKDGCIIQVTTTANEDEAEIVGTSGLSGGVQGVAVIESNTWADSRDLFTSRNYHITEINDDLSVPKVEPNNWESHNTWLTQLTTGGSGFGTPTLKWHYANSGFGEIHGDIAIAPLHIPPGEEEKGSASHGSEIRVLYKNGEMVALFNLSKREEVKIRIFDLAGRMRKTLNLGTMDSGMHEIPLKLTNFKNGIYFIRARLGEEMLTSKTLIIR